MQLITLYGQNAMRSVLEEKNNRIVEVIVSSVHATQLMAGKVLGLAAVALLQVGIWVGFAALLMHLAGRALGDGRGGAHARRGLAPAVWATILVFFILGFVLYAAMYAAAGSDGDQRAGGAAAGLSADDAAVRSVAVHHAGAHGPAGEHGPHAVADPLHLAGGDAHARGGHRRPAAGDRGVHRAAGAWDVLGVLWLAGKIYRVGILSTGKKPTLRELGRWLRAA